MKKSSIGKRSIFNAIESISYQKNSVISRTIMGKPSGTVTLFAFDKGQGLSAHRAPFDAIAYVIDGKAHIVLAGKVNKLKAGEIIIMPANIPHALRAVESFKMLLVMIRL